MMDTAKGFAQEIKMAKVSAHGTVVGTVYFTARAKRYMSDGAVLENSGHGWKLRGKLKAGLTPQAAYEAQLAKQREAEKTHPAAFAYRKELHDLAPLCKRWKLHAAVTMMPDDADGVWSEACDGFGDNIAADVDDIVRLCGLYRLAIKESENV